jgi:crotonobetainyl-CoA:carnitine CoA-transferase CaiB-like acyl-CoA transferase
MKALKGIRVLDFSTVFAGPHCGQLLGDYGADVIKIEPKAGDDSRNWQPLHQGKAGAGTLFLVVNRNKRSVVVDLKSPDGIEIIRRLVRQSDVVLQNFSAGVMDRLGLGYPQLKQDNKRLVYCSISAFGETGPMARARGYDPVIQAFSGMMQIPEEGGPPPARLSIPLIDFTTGQNAFAGILAALIQRGTTGEGTYLEVCLADSAVALQAWGLQRVWGTEGQITAAAAANTGKPVISDNVPYESFQASDGFVYIACGNNKLWQLFCGAIGRSDLPTNAAFVTNPLRRENYAALMDTLRPLIAGKTRAHWERVFVAAGVPFAPVNNLQELAVHPQTVASDIVQTYASPHFGTIKTVARAVRFAGEVAPVGTPPPALGEHTRAVLREAGYADQEIDGYQAAGVVAGA